MKYLTFLIFISLLFTSCGDTSTQTQQLVYVCSCEQQKEVSAWVKESINNANNHSDEEMEDVISQLERTAVRVTCQQKLKTFRYNNGSVVSVEKDSCETIFHF